MEYKVLSVFFTNGWEKKLEGHLNHYGQDGFRLCRIDNYRSGILVVMERRKEEGNDDER